MESLFQRILTHIIETEKKHWWGFNQTLSSYNFWNQGVVEDAGWLCEPLYRKNIVEKNI